MSSLFMQTVVCDITCFLYTRWRRRLCRQNGALHHPICRYV